jgi:hypothetical protein
MMIILCCSCSQTDITFWDNFKTSDWISIAGLVINGIIAVLVITTIQRRLNNKRILKDHIIKEVIDLRTEYRSFLNQLYKNKISPKQVTPWFKLMNIKAKDLIDIISYNQKIKMDYLSPYQVDLRQIVTELEEFQSNYKTDEKIELGSISKSEVIRFQQENNHLFNKLILEISSAK